jgi:hypothetical protein
MCTLEKIGQRMQKSKAMKNFVSTFGSPAFKIVHIIVFGCVCISAFMSNPESQAAELDRLREAIYQHNKVVLDMRHQKYGGHYEPEDYAVNNKYKYALIDLNDDKIDDAIVLFDSSCGSGGCNMEIYRGTKTGFEYLSGSTITSEPIRVTSEIRYGWKTLIVFSNGSGNVLMRFNGRRYPLNPSLQPKAIKSQINSAISILDLKK